MELFILTRFEDHAGEVILGIYPTLKMATKGLKAAPLIQQEGGYAYGEWSIFCAKADPGVKDQPIWEAPI